MSSTSEEKNASLWDYESKVIWREPAVIGVAGGDTKTTCVCVATPLPTSVSDLRPLSQCVTGCSNYKNVGVEAARQAIMDSMAGAMRQGNVRRSSVLSVCVAAPGIDLQSEMESLQEWIRKIFSARVEIFVQNDAVAVLASACDGRLKGFSGCVLVADTGTIALGLNERGEFARASGGGPLLGDQGSGFAVAQQALQAVMQALDGRGPETSLKEAILTKLQLSSAEDLIGWMYADKSWARVAALVPVVKACAHDGDPVASKLLESVVSELACSVQAVVKSQSLAGRDGHGSFPFVMSGSLLESGDGPDIRESLVEKVLKMFPGAKPITPKVEPAFGAALLAWGRYHDNQVMKKVGDL